MPVPPDVPKGLQSEVALSDVLDAKAYAQLLGRAKDLKLKHLWKLDGWTHPLEPSAKDDPLLKDLSVEEMNSITKALERHVEDHGDRKGWKKASPIYSGACSFCSAVTSPASEP